MFLRRLFRRKGSLSNNQKIKKFEDLSLGVPLLRGMTSCGIEKPTQIQKTAIQPCLQGRDVIIHNSDRCGKSTALNIAILQNIDLPVRQCQALILSSGRTEALENNRMLEGLGQEMEGLRCLPLIGGKQVPVDGGCVSTGAHLINCTPGWSRDLIEEGYIETNEIKMLVIDNFNDMIVERNKEDLKVIKKNLNTDAQVFIACRVLTQEILDICRTLTHDPHICHR